MSYKLLLINICGEGLAKLFSLARDCSLASMSPCHLRWLGMQRRGINLFGKRLLVICAWHNSVRKQECLMSVCQRDSLQFIPKKYFLLYFSKVPELTELINSVISMFCVKSWFETSSQIKSRHEHFCNIESLIHKGPRLRHCIQCWGLEWEFLQTEKKKTLVLTVKRGLEFQSRLNNTL